VIIFILLNMWQLEEESHKENIVGFEFLIVMTMKSIIFWDVMPCSLVHQFFR
jgi:hypothetical protein